MTEKYIKAHGSHWNSTEHYAVLVPQEITAQLEQDVRIAAEQAQVRGDKAAASRLQALAMRIGHALPGAVNADGDVQNVWWHPWAVATDNWIKDCGGDSWPAVNQMIEKAQRIALDKTGAEGLAARDELVRRLRYKTNEVAGQARMFDPEQQRLSAERVPEAGG